MTAKGALSILLEDGEEDDGDEEGEEEEKEEEVEEDAYFSASEEEVPGPVLGA